MDLGKRIKDRRKELGLSAETVAEKMGVSPATVYRYESAEIMNMGIDKVESIANALYTTPAYLMGWTDEQPMTKKESRLFSDFRSLNPSGQDKAVDYVADLADNPKYQIQEEPDSYEPETIAAHHETGSYSEDDLNDIEILKQKVAKMKRERK